MISVENAKGEVVKLLVPVADLTIRNIKKETIADLAFQQKNPDIKNILVKDFDDLRNLAEK